MADNRIRIDAQLDIASSAELINKQLENELPNRLNDLQLRCAINTSNEVISALQSQLDRISNNLHISVGNINLGNINLGNVTTQMQNITQTATNTTREVERLNQSLHNLSANQLSGTLGSGASALVHNENSPNSINVAQTIRNLESLYSNFKSVATSATYCGNAVEGFSVRITDANDAVKQLNFRISQDQNSLELFSQTYNNIGTQRLFERTLRADEAQMQKNIKEADNYSLKLSALKRDADEFGRSLETWYQNPTTNTPLRTNLEGLSQNIEQLRRGETTIENVRAQYNALQSEINSMSAAAKSTFSSSLNPLTNIIAKAKDLQQIINDLNNSYSALNSKNQESLRQFQNNAQMQLSTFGALSPDDQGRYIEAYGRAKQAVDEYANALKRAKQEEAKDNSSVAKVQSAAIKELTKKYAELNAIYNKYYSGNVNIEQNNIYAARESELNAEIEGVKTRLQTEGLITEEIAKQIADLEIASQRQRKLAAAANNWDKELNKANSTIQGAITKLDKMQLAPTLTNFAGTDSRAIDVVNHIRNLREEYLKLQTSLKTDSSPQNIITIKARLGELETELSSVTKGFGLLQSSLKAQSAATTFANNIKKATANLEAWANANKKAVSSQKMMSSGKTYAQTWQELVRAFNSGNINPDQFKHLNEQLRIFQTEAKAAKLTSSSFFASMGNQLKSIIARYTSFYMILGKVKEMLTTVSSLDAAMINLRRVTNESNEMYIKFFETAHVKAQELHSDLVDIVDQTTAWVKLGYDLQDAANLTEISSEYIKLSGVDQETGVKNIITAMKAYNIEAADAARITDEFYEVGNKFALSSADIGAGLTVSASALANTGNTLEESIALLAGGGEITQDLNSMGSAVRTVAMRLQGMKGALEELGEDSEGIESISKVQTQILNLTKGRVNIFKDDGTFKSTYQILKEISEVYYDLSDPDRANLTEIMFGKMRANQGIAILQAFSSGQIERIYDTASNASGAIAKGFEEQSESIAYHLANFKEEWQKISAELFNSDGLKFLIDSGTTILNGLEGITKLLGNMPTLIAAIAAAVASIKGNNITNLFTLSKTKTSTALGGDNIARLFGVQGTNVGIAGYVNEFNQLQSSINTTYDSYEAFYKRLETGGVPPQTIAAFRQLGNSAEKTQATIVGMNETLLANSRGYQGVTTAMSAYNQAATYGSQVQQGIVNTIGASNTNLQGYLQSLNGAKASMGGYVAYLAAARVKTIALQAAQMALNMALATLVSTIISKAISAIKELATAEEEARKKRLEDADEISETYKSEITYTEDLKKKYADLATSTSDITEQRRKLVDIQNELNDKYGEEAEKIDVLNSNYTELIENAREKQRVEAQEYLQENQVAIEEAQKVLTNRQALYDENGLRRYTQFQIESTDDLVRSMQNSSAAREIEAEGLGNWETELRNAWENIEGVSYIARDKLTGDSIAIEGTIYEQRDALKSMRNAYEEWEGHDAKRLQQLTDLIKIYDEVITKEEEYTNAAESSYKIIADAEATEKIAEQYNTLIDKSTEAIQKYNEYQNAGASNVALSKAQGEIVNLHNQLIELTDGNATLRSEVNNLFEDYLPNLEETKTVLTDITDLQADWNDIVEGSFKTTLDDVEKYKTAMQDLANGDYLEWKDVQPLIWDLDTEHAINDIQVVNDQYKLSIDEISRAKDNEIKKEIERIETQIELQIEARDAAIAAAQATIDATSLATRHSRNPVYAEAVAQLKRLRDGTDDYTLLVNKATAAVGALKSQLGDTVDRTEALKERQSKLNDEIDDLKKKSDNYSKAMTSSIDNVIDKLNDEKEALDDQLDALNEQLDVLEEQQEQIEDIIDNYQKLADVVKSAVDEQISLLEEQQKAAEEAVEARINALKEEHDRQEEENDLTEKQIALQERLRDLDKARQTKVRTYSSERGWHFDVDKEAVSNAETAVAEAQKTYDDALADKVYNDHLKALEAEKDAVSKSFEEQISAYEDYAKLWEETANEQTTMEEERLAQEILGSDWRQKINAKDINILNSYQSRFRSYNSQLNNLVNGEIANLKRSIEAKETEIKAKEEQINEWNKYKSKVESTIKELENANSEYNQYMKDIALDENSTFYDREVNLWNFKEHYKGYLDEIADKQKEVNDLAIEMNAVLGQLDLSDFMNRVNDAVTNVHSSIDEMRLRLYAMRSVGSFADGGVSTSTGFALVHATKQKSEVTLNAAQGRSLYDMVKTGNFSNLVADKAVQGISTALRNSKVNTASSGDINISVGQVITNNPADFMKQLDGYMNGYMKNYWRTKLTESYTKNK